MLKPYMMAVLKCNGISHSTRVQLSLSRVLDVRVVGQGVSGGGCVYLHHSFDQLGGALATLDHLLGLKLLCLLCVLGILGQQASGTMVTHMSTTQICNDSMEGVIRSNIYWKWDVWLTKLTS